MTRHATHRTDFTLIAECPYNGRIEPLMIEGPFDYPNGEKPLETEHLTLEATATNSDIDPKEAFPIENCPVCDAPLDMIIQETPSEVLE